MLGASCALAGVGGEDGGGRAESSLEGRRLGPDGQGEPESA